MKILKNLAVLAAASAFILAGCQNNFTGTTLDTSALTAQNRSVNIWTSLGLTPVSGTLTNAKDQLITIDFGIEEIDAATIKSGVIIYNLTSATVPAVYGQGTAISYTVKAVSGQTATLLADLSSASGTIEVFFDSTKLTARNGSTKLNRDNDLTAGEAGDDDQYQYMTVTGGTAVTGSQRSAHVMTVTPAWTTPLSTTAINTVTVTYNLEAALIDTADYSSTFKDYYTVEQYSTSSKAWSAVALTYVSKAAGVYTYSFPAATAGITYRLKSSNLQNLKSTTAIFGFTQRASTQDNYTTKIVNSTTAPDTTELALQTGVFTSGNAVDANGSNKIITLKYFVTSGTTVGDKGIDESTFTADNVKIYNTNDKVFMKISSIVFMPTDTSDTSKTIAILLDPAYTKTGNTYDVYVGTGLKSLGDADGTPAAGHFGANSAITENLFSNNGTYDCYSVGFIKAASTTF